MDNAALITAFAPLLVEGLHPLLLGKQAGSRGQLPPHSLLLPGVS